MGFCWNGLGWGISGGLGMVGLILSVVSFAGMFALLGLGALWVVRQFGRPGTLSTATEDSLGIARRRLAAGEITIDQFEEIRHRLQR
jgi:uncharacterized membrane protein